MSRPGHPSEAHLEGRVERVTFHSPDTGFCVLRVAVRGRREPVAVVGRAPQVHDGETVQAEGAWERDPKHGMQFKARELRVLPPATREGVEKYLGSGMIRGIGPAFAKRLVERFGDRVLEVIETEPERLRELPGIGPKRVAQVRKAWVEQRAIRDLMVFLQSNGIGTARAVRIHKTYGEEAIATLRANPYRLALDVHGIGFRIADDLAHRLGVPHDSPLRAAAGTRHVLTEIATSGHCAASRPDVVETTSRLLEVDEAVAERAIDDAVRDGYLVEETHGGTPYVFLRSLQRAEAGVASRVAQLLEGPPPWGELAVDRALPWVAARTGVTLAPSQARAAHVALGNKVVVVTGGPGVGKTTLLDSLLRIVLAKKRDVRCCAPTGRAAKRMTESTGLDAKTIHRLLEFDPRRGGFKRNRERPLDCDLVVVDESSMVDVSLMHALLWAVPDHAALWLVGDVDQIPSVGPGRVLADVIASGPVPTVRLTEVFRQAAESRIVVNAHRIHRGEMPEAPSEASGASDFFFIKCADAEEVERRLLDVVLERVPRAFGLDPVRDLQVLTPMNRGSLGTQALNAVLRERLNPSASPTVTRFGATFGRGDKVVQTVNDYDKDVFNGDLGVIEHIDPEEGVVTVRFEERAIPYEASELDELQLAYATTVHKAQGSEYPAVVLPLSTQHYAMLDRNLLYTAVTRGKRLVVLIGEPKAVAVALKSTRSHERVTFLAERLGGALREVEGA